ncbi:hypothetical protein AMK09_19475 [Streptomyces sp. CB02488]|uniref:hypothetical protein n=1 Tax=unclassified Streptomyces TaxID=2593676 RepID=UPI00093D5DF2|nr:MULTISPECIES: hypothetical protein [unclassified Streptomyces]OKK17895.1 hypothetical protein AMK09_19475 [Streptomyces sp. CB02488]
MFTFSTDARTSGRDAARLDRNTAFAAEAENVCPAPGTTTSVRTVTTASPACAKALGPDTGGTAAHPLDGTDSTRAHASTKQ